MPIFNLGSINIDHIYRLPHLPQPSETLLAEDYLCCLGGKGANQSLALALAGAKVVHIGRMNARDRSFVKPLINANVSLKHVSDCDSPTASAVVMVDSTSGENQIVINPGANLKISEIQINTALEEAQPNDWALTQNETSLVPYFIAQAKKRGMQICYSAAPFVAETTIGLLPIVDLLVVNQIEAESLADTLGVGLNQIPVPHLVITLGAEGARYISNGTRNESSEKIDWQIRSPKVNAIDTTGAGDTFLGFMLAALTQGMSMRDAVQQALYAGALQVTRIGTAEAIPTLTEVAEFKANIAQ